jgi:hypoxanthine phosphoribosyltransferase
MIPAGQAQDYLQHSEVICRPEEVQAALARLAGEITARLGGSQPLVLAVMGGAVVFVGQLLPQLAFPLDFDYVHVSRYGDRQQGGELHWKVQPQHEVLKGRVVLVLDDILDEGETLAAVRQRVLELGAAEFHCAVFVDKRHGKPKPLSADFVGIEVPDRFVFGYGMDIHGAWRNLPAIHALKEN